MKKAKFTRSYALLWRHSTSRIRRVCDVKAGHIILVPPGVQHGLASDDPDCPLKVLMTFHPGLAPVEMPAFRDEKIVYPNASLRAVEITQESGYE